MDLSVSLSQLFLISVRSFLVASGLLLFTRAMKHMEISVVSPMKSLTPFFLLFLSVFFLGESVSFIQIIGIFLIVSGSYFLQIHSHYLDLFRHFKKDFNNKYLFYALAGSAIFAISAMISKIAIVGMQPTTYMYYSYIFMAIFFTATIYFHYDGWTDIKYGFKKTSLWVFPIAATLLLADWTYFYALSLPIVMVALILPIRRLSALFSTIVGGNMFHDHFLFHKIASAVIIVIGATLIII